MRLGWQIESRFLLRWGESGVLFQFEQKEWQQLRLLKTHQLIHGIRVSLENFHWFAVRELAVINYFDQGNKETDETNNENQVKKKKNDSPTAK